MEKGHRFALWGRGEGSGASQGVTVYIAETWKRRGRGCSSQASPRAWEWDGGGGPNNTVNSNEERELTQPCLE